MDQKKIGSFLKELRKQKGITQEELAEQLNVSGRTVSRWETGNNMPDISILIELAELYDVSIPEIVNGERKNESMNEEVKEVAQSLSDYADLEKENILKQIRNLSIMGVAGLLVYGLLYGDLKLTNFRMYHIILSLENKGLLKHIHKSDGEYYLLVE